MEQTANNVSTVPHVSFCGDLEIEDHDYLTQFGVRDLNQWRAIFTVSKLTEGDKNHAPGSKQNVNILNST
jgi:hypothetical protein